MAIHRRARVYSVATAALAFVGLVVACSDLAPVGVPGSFGGAGAGCSTPEEGCACTPGAEAACGFVIKGDDNFIWCGQGTRACAGGAWGACQANGQVAVRSRPPLASGVHINGLGSPGACGALNACDPYCNVMNDTPGGGFNPGPGFGTSGGGIVAYVPACGDGKRTGAEECDDGNLTNGDGCSDACSLEVGFVCPVPGSPCTAAAFSCGNGVLEPGEECDDNGVRPYDGCSPTCRKEPSCPTGTCLPVCGDGLKFAAEGCDDGNTVNGDGCSSTCTVEPGAVCNVLTSALPPTISVPIIYRDFTPATHPDFESFSGAATGIVQNTLGADQEPVFAATKGVVTNAASFFEWYHDGPNNRVIFDTLTLTKQAGNSYQFSSTNFFPLNGKGFGNFASTGKNFHFTSEARTPFTFAGGETLSFSGDDDVWVFINGKLVVDLGGVHGALAGSVTLTPAVAAGLGLTVGGTYEIAVFQAERHTTGSNYTLTLGGFVRAKSDCTVPTSLTIVRDYEGVCLPGNHPKWQLFRWRAAVPVGTSIAFRAATADDAGALPTAPLAAPTTVDIGSATAINSPLAGPVVFVSETSPTTPFGPVPVSESLRTEASTGSKRFLRVFMTFSPSATVSPRLDEWQQLYDCVPSE